MSYDLRLVNPENQEVINLPNPHNLQGGTYAEGSTLAELNVTYNYSAFYDGIGTQGLRSLQGLTGQESATLLQQAIGVLAEVPRPSDYWQPSEANARWALRDLLTLAELAPQGVWRVE